MYMYFEILCYRVQGTFFRSTATRVRFMYFVPVLSATSAASPPESNASSASSDRPRLKAASPSSSTSSGRAGRPPRGSRGSQGGARERASCTLCGKMFNNSSALAKHKLTHSDERKHVCPICSKAFKRQDHL